MCEHADLPAMVGFVSEHVAQHLHANRPWPGPAISHKLLDATTSIEGFCQHLRATSATLGQCGTGLLRRAVRAIELAGNLQVRSGGPDPLGPDIVHVREDRRDGADSPGRFGVPGGWLKTLNENLVQSLVRGKDADG